MQTLLASAVTSDTNLITPTTVYCTYPNLVGDRTSIRTDLPQYRPCLRSSSIYKIVNTNAHWKRGCGAYCLSLPRNTAEDKGIATFRWNLNIEKPISTRRGGGDHRRCTHGACMSCIRCVMLPSCVTVWSTRNRPPAYQLDTSRHSRMGIETPNINTYYVSA